jgi:hypothetical protein
LFGLASLLKASVRPRIGSAGPIGMSDQIVRFSTGAHTAARGLTAPATALRARVDSIAENCLY